jgi:hypothetical protein
MMAPCEDGTSAILQWANNHKVAGNPVQLHQIVHRPAETVFRSLAHTPAELGRAINDYDTAHPHSRLGWMTPTSYVRTRWFSAQLRLRSLRGPPSLLPNGASPPARLRSALDKLGSNITF